ncbi:MAG TPA: hypothetical protein VGS20_00530 [Candidatus Acidoferrales bacterium]|nr:hypothetical protein [Candidatus Acidoferrales bacterium]
MAKLSQISRSAYGWTSARRPLALLLTAAMALFAGRPARTARQSAKPPASGASNAFVGTWKASFKGTTFITLAVKMSGAKLSGSLSHAMVSLDSGGNVADVKPEPGSKPVTIVKVDADTLYFNSTTEQPVRFAMKLKDKTHAELSFLNATPNGAVVPKPIEMVLDQAKQ